MDTQATSEKTAQAKRERRTSYFVVGNALAFTSKAQVERYLAERGGLEAGTQIIKGLPIEAKQQSVFKIN